jgi:protoheme IX farnesyltransferase
MKSFSVHAILTLIKYKVSLAVTFTAITGYIVYTGSLDLHILKLALGVFILAGGSSGLNEYQERISDSKMPRTMSRPIPSGKISPDYALIISILFILTGIFVLLLTFGIIPALLGVFNVVWYNLFYTNLKRITPFAVVPGSLVGAVPVIIGWTAAGGSVFESTIVFIAFFIFIWQIPHFWLLMLKYGQEYQQAGFPTINQSFSHDSLKKIIFTWVLATSAFSISIPLFLRNISLFFFLFIFALNIVFVLIFSTLSFGKVTEFSIKKSFISINIYMFLFMVMLMIKYLFAP